MKDKLTILINRLKRIGITIELYGNYPWIYLHKVNDNVVKEKFCSEHFFTIAFLKQDGKDYTFTDIGEVFRIIRKYK